MWNQNLGSSCAGTKSPRRTCWALSRKCRRDFSTLTRILETEESAFLYIEVVEFSLYRSGGIFWISKWWDFRQGEGFDGDDGGALEAVCGGRCSVALPLGQHRSLQVYLSFVVIYYLYTSSTRIDPDVRRLPPRVTQSRDTRPKKDISTRLSSSFQNTNTQIQIHWYKYTNTNTLIQIHLYKYNNTNAIIQIQ